MHRLVIALVTLLGLTGVAVVAAYLLLFAAGTDRAARLAPADTAVYVNVYLQPSAGQQMNLSELIGRFPGFADDATLDDKIDQIVQNLLTGAGIDYRSEVRPWLGNQLALAARPGEADVADAEPLLIAEVKDLEAARSSVGDLVTGDGAPLRTEPYRDVEVKISTDSAHAFVAGMLVIGPDAAAVHRVIDVSHGAESLAAREDFRRTMDGMPADHLAAVFVDLAAIARAADAEQQLDAVATAGAVLVAEQDGLRLSGSAPFTTTDPASSPRPRPAIGHEPSTLPQWMPDDTIAEVVVFGLRQALEDAEVAAAGVPQGEELIGALDALRAIAAFALGIDLDADVLPLLDREVGMAFAGFEGDLPSGQLVLRPEDPAVAASALDTIAERLSSIGAETGTETVGGVAITVLALPEVGEVAYAAVEDVIVIGLGTDDVVAALEAHDSGTSLALSDAYRRTFEIAGARAGTEAWVNVAALIDAVGAPAELDDDVRDILGQIGAFGFTAPSRDNEIEFHAVLTITRTE